MQEKITTKTTSFNYKIIDLLVCEWEREMRIIKRRVRDSNQKYLIRERKSNN